jgi:hypothetical protein
MFGLQYILQTYKVPSSEIADEMKINRANISMWIKNKKVPENKIDFLENKFKRIPREFFNKELKPSEMITVQKYYLMDTDEWEVIELPWIDDDGNEHMVEQTFSHHQGIIQQLDGEYERLSMIERIEKVINGEPELQYMNTKMFQQFILVMEEYDQQHIEFLKMVFYFLKTSNQWGVDPAFSESKSEKAMYDDFNQFLKKYNIIKPEE